MSAADLSQTWSSLSCHLARCQVSGVLLKFLTSVPIFRIPVDVSLSPVVPSTILLDTGHRWWWTSGSLRDLQCCEVVDSSSRHFQKLFLFQWGKIVWKCFNFFIIIIDYKIYTYTHFFQKEIHMYPTNICKVILRSGPFAIIHPRGGVHWCL